MVCCLVFAVCNVLFALFLVVVVVVVVEISFFFFSGKQPKHKILATADLDTLQ